MPEKIMEGVYRLAIPLKGNPLKELNAYLIRGERSLLIDTGFRNESCRRALFGQLESLGLYPGDVDVLLTHLHPDHSGLCREAAGETGRIYISRPDSYSIGPTPRWRDHWDRTISRMLSEGFPEELVSQFPMLDPRRSTAPPRDIPHFCIEDGDAVEVGGYRLQCRMTPGHTPGHMCFWMEEQGVLFLGDHVLFDISPNITFWVDFPDSLGRYMESLREIAKLDVRLALPAHRRSGALRPRVEELLLHHAQRLKETVSILEDSPGLSAYDLAQKLSWRVHAEDWEHFPLMQKWFAFGETVAHLDHLAAQGRVRREAENGPARYRPV